MPISKKRIEEIKQSIGKSKILILGDSMIDEYLLGKVTRISPEAPVPVVDIERTRRLLGGAANVASNIRSLGDEPLLLAAVGSDSGAENMKHLLADHGMSADYLIVDHSRQTTVKTRVIAHSQQVVRADQETRKELPPEIEDKFVIRIKELLGDISAVIISDYGKGVVTLSLLKQVIDLCVEKGIFIAVDPKETRFHHYERVSLITPNHHEAGFAYGMRINNEEDLIEVGNGLLNKLKAGAILITRGSKGMSLFRRENEPTHIPTFAKKVYDVTGAGDTVIATYVSAIVAGANHIEAAIFANAGAGFTVAEVGTATVTKDQLCNELNRNIINGRLREGGLKS